MVHSEESCPFSLRVFGIRTFEFSRLSTSSRSLLKITLVVKYVEPT